MSAPFDPGVFPPEQLAAMGQAYERICEELTCKKSEAFVREVVADRIIAMAKRGETNAEQLIRLVLGYLPEGNAFAVPPNENTGSHQAA